MSANFFRLRGLEAYEKGEVQRAHECFSHMAEINPRGMVDVFVDSLSRVLPPPVAAERTGKAKQLYRVAISFLPDEVEEELFLEENENDFEKESETMKSPEDEVEEADQDGGVSGDEGSVGKASLSIGGDGEIAEKQPESDNDTPKLESVGSSGGSTVSSSGSDSSSHASDTEEDELNNTGMFFDEMRPPPRAAIPDISPFNRMNLPRTNPSLLLLDLGSLNKRLERNIQNQTSTNRKRFETPRLASPAPSFRSSLSSTFLLPNIDDPFKLNTDGVTTRMHVGVLKGVCELHMARFAEAAKSLKMALDHHAKVPQRPKTLDSSVYVYRALACFLSNDFEGCYDACDRAAEISPDMYQAHTLRACALNNEGVYDMALAAATKSIQLSKTMGHGVNEVQPIVNDWAFTTRGIINLNIFESIRMEQDFIEVEEFTMRLQERQKEIVAKKRALEEEWARNNYDDEDFEIWLKEREENDRIANMNEVEYEDYMAAKDSEQNSRIELESDIEKAMKEFDKIEKEEDLAIKADEKAERIEYEEYWRKVKEKLIKKHGRDRGTRDWRKAKGEADKKEKERIAAQKEEMAQLRLQRREAKKAFLEAESLASLAEKLKPDDIINEAAKRAEQQKQSDSEVEFEFQTLEEREEIRGYMSKCLDSAVSDLSDAVELNPFNVVALSYRGYALWKLGKYAQAVRDCSRAIGIDPIGAPDVMACVVDDTSVFKPKPRTRQQVKSLLAIKKVEEWDKADVENFFEADLGLDKNMLSKVLVKMSSIPNLPVDMDEVPTEGSKPTSEEIAPEALSAPPVVPQEVIPLPDESVPKTAWEETSPAFTPTVVMAPPAQDAGHEVPAEKEAAKPFESEPSPQAAPETESLLQSMTNQPLGSVPEESEEHSAVLQSMTNQPLGSVPEESEEHSAFTEAAKKASPQEVEKPVLIQGEEERRKEEGEEVMVVGMTPSAAITPQTEVVSADDPPAPAEMLPVQAEISAVHQEPVKSKPESESRTLVPKQEPVQTAPPVPISGVLLKKLSKRDLMEIGLTERQASKVLEKTSQYDNNYEQAVEEDNARKEEERLRKEEEERILQEERERAMKAQEEEKARQELARIQKEKKLALIDSYKTDRSKGGRFAVKYKIEEAPVDKETRARNAKEQIALEKKAKEEELKRLKKIEEEKKTQELLAASAERKKKIAHMAKTGIRFRFTGKEEELAKKQQEIEYNMMLEREIEMMRKQERKNEIEAENVKADVLRKYNIQTRATRQSNKQAKFGVQHGRRW